MKLLMIYCNQFACEPKVKTLPDYPDYTEKVTYNGVLVGFIQMEKQDEDNMKYVETKLVKNLKWAAKKNQTKKVILHSFAHLSTSKAAPEITKSLFDLVEQRLLNADYTCSQTPFGYFLDIDVQAPGRSSARIFMDI